MLTTALTRKISQLGFSLSLFATLMLTGCGGGSGSGGSPPPAPTVNPTTQAIAANMAINYNNEQVTLSAAIQGCSRTYPGASGAFLICGVTAKETDVQNFLNVVLTNIQTVNNSTPIDKTAIANLLSSYQTQDLAWLTVNSFAPYIMTTAEVAGLAPAYDSSINTSYSNASIQLGAM